jgi:hypothetical protein
MKVVDHDEEASLAGDDRREGDDGVKQAPSLAFGIGVR